MSKPQRPSDEEIAKILQRKVSGSRPLTVSIADISVQVDKTAPAEPAFRTRIINNLNKQDAEHREGLCIRIPQPSPGHCPYSLYKWTHEEAAVYFTSGELPRDLTTIGKDSVVLTLWIFDARGCGGELPEVQFEERVPDFKKHPALCAFDMDGDRWIALIPSEFLDMVPTGKDKVKFVVNEKGKGKGSAGKKEEKNEGGKEGGRTKR